MRLLQRLQNHLRLLISLLIVHFEPVQEREIVNAAPGLYELVLCHCGLGGGVGAVGGGGGGHGASLVLLKV